MDVGTTFLIHEYDGLEGHYWFIQPEGMTFEQAWDGEHQGPFATEAESRENQRLMLLGEQCKVQYGGMWDPNWDKPQ